MNPPINPHQLPKIDLHHHFDGAFVIEDLYAEAQRRTLPQGRLTADEFRARCQVKPECRSLTEFLAVFDFFYDIAQDLQFLNAQAAQLPKRMAETGVIYLETRFAPHLFTGSRFSAAEVTESVVAGLEQSSAVPVRLIICAMRNAPLAHVQELVDLYHRFQARGVCGIDLAGDESRFACREYAPAFNRAREAKVPITIHAGEATGPQSVIDALDLFHARRIGHGIRSIDDAALVERLAAEKITLEVCLTSNLQTGNAPDYQQHPFLRLMRAGVPVTINTDDPTVSGIDLTYEWQKAIDEYQFDAAACQRVLANAINGAFCSETLKKDLEAKIAAFFG